MNILYYNFQFRFLRFPSSPPPWGALSPRADPAPSLFWGKCRGLGIFGENALGTRVVFVLPAFPPGRMTQASSPPRWRTRRTVFGVAPRRVLPPGESDTAKSGKIRKFNSRRTAEFGRSSISPQPRPRSHLRKTPISGRKSELSFHPLIQLLKYLHFPCIYI